MQVREMARMGCRSCWRQGDWAEAHGRRRFGRAEAAIEGLAKVAGVWQGAVQRKVMRLPVTVAARDVGM